MVNALDIRRPLPRVCVITLPFLVSWVSRLARSGVLLPLVFSLDAAHSATQTARTSGGSAAMTVRAEPA